MYSACRALSLSRVELNTYFFWMATEISVTRKLQNVSWASAHFCHISVSESDDAHIQSKKKHQMSCEKPPVNSDARPLVWKAVAKAQIHKDPSTSIWPLLHCSTPPFFSHSLTYSLTRTGVLKVQPFYASIEPDSHPPKSNPETVSPYVRPLTFPSAIPKNLRPALVHRSRSRSWENRLSFRRAPWLTSKLIFPPVESPPVRFPKTRGESFRNNDRFTFNAGQKAGFLAEKNKVQPPFQSLSCQARKLWDVFSKTRSSEQHYRPHSQ